MALIKNISPSHWSDAELVSHYQNSNDQNILARLFLHYSDLVYGCCVKYLGDQEAAKDAVMNIYYELVEKLKTHEVANFKSWLYVVTKNYCLMQLRKDKKHRVVSFEPDVMQSADVYHLDAVLDKEAKLDHLEYCMQALQAEQQECVRLFYMEHKCYNEIAGITGKDWGKIKSLIQNGRRNLKICMEQHV